MICTEKNNKAGYMALILVFSFLMGVSHVFGADANDTNNPLIGKSTSSITFAPDDISKAFQIWNAGTGRLHYALDINGADANFFTIDGVNEVNGESNDINDSNSHIVSVKSHSTALSAQIVITNESNSVDINYITLTATINGPNEPNTPSSPLIGLSTSHIQLVGKVISKRFQIWNKGTGTLSYTLTISGDAADSFILDREDGESTGINDKQTYTVYVNYDDLHNTTLSAQIEITDGGDNTAYITLSATETIATRVSYIAIEQGITYGTPGEVNDVNDFRLYIDTDNTVDELNLTTPEGKSLVLTDANYIESEDGNVLYWTYTQSDINLLDYGDGDYIIEADYTDGDSAQTIINFGIANRPGTILWPRQTPVLINPQPDDHTVSPVRFAWDKCTDPNVNVIRLVVEKSCDGDCDENSIALEYGKGTQKSSGVNLSPGEWGAELNFGRQYHGDNVNDIDYDVGKYSRSQNSFEIMKWFGTFGTVKNHLLKLTDCNGTEVTFNLTGGGKGEVNGDDCSFDSIDLTGTTVKSVLSITTKNGAVTSVGAINVNSDTNSSGDIKAIEGRNVDLDGDLSIDGGAKEIVLNDIAAGSDISIGSPASSKTTCAMKFGSIDDLTLSSDTPIKSLTATEWLSGSLETSWISTMTIKGNFDADITLSGIDSPKGMTLKSAKIAGELGETTWQIEDGNCGTIQVASAAQHFIAAILGNVGTIKAVGNKKAGISSVLKGRLAFKSVKTIEAAEISDCTIVARQEPNLKPLAIGKIAATGWMSNCIIATTGDVGSIIAGGMQDTTIYGIIMIEVPTENYVHSLGRLQIKGIKNQAYGFINSNISAAHIVNATLAYPEYINLIDGQNTIFGLTAEAIDKLTIKDSASTQTFENLVEPNDSITIQDLVIALE